MGTIGVTSSSVTCTLVCNVHVLHVYRLLNDDELGGGSAGGHALVTALHLFKTLKSSRKFRNTVVNHYRITYCEVECLKPFYEQLRVLHTCM